MRTETTLFPYDFAANMLLTPCSWSESDLMIVEKRDLVSFEPLVFDLVSSGEAVKGDAIERAIGDWLAQRERTPVCNNDCSRKFLLVRPIDHRSVQVLVEWVCAECLTLLLHSLESEFPILERARVGLPPEPPHPAPRGGSLRFSGRSVTLEDGHVEWVDPFEISAAPVSVQEMRTFCQEAGYQTSAERRQSMNVYYKNAYIDFEPKKVQEKLPADFLSYRDAGAFCNWARCRLPREGEYFVASLIDDAVHELSPEQMRAYVASGRVFLSGNRVITSTCVDDGIVVRSGPFIAKRPGWEAEVHLKRKLVHEDDPIGKIYTVRN
jgi:hypothetical protein